LIGRALKWFVIVLVLLVVLRIHQAAAVELDKRAHAPRPLYSVNGHQMLWSAWASEAKAVRRSFCSPAHLRRRCWYRVQTQRPNTQVCAFDRPGMG
jgi:hypothetical protein